MTTFQVFYRKSLRDTYDHPIPLVEGVAFEHVADVHVEVDSTADALEVLYRAMNVVSGADFEIPQKIRNRSMSVGDVAVTEAGAAFICCSAGWAGCAIPEGARKNAPSFSVPSPCG